MHEIIGLGMKACQVKALTFLKNKPRSTLISEELNDYVNNSRILEVWFKMNTHTHCINVLESFVFDCQQLS